MTRKNKIKTKRAPAQKGFTQLKKELEQIKKTMKPRKANTPFADVGGHLGNLLGFKDIGSGIGSVIGRIFGSGDYQTNFSSVRHNDLTSPVPAFGGESTIITHREYIKDIVSSSSAGAFSIETFRINPTNDELFPWLAQIATCFEEYTIHGMVFEFKSMSGQSVASTNTALGSVIVATQYDPTKLAFTSKQQMENYYFAQSTVPSQSVLHAIECKSGSAPLRSLYTSGGAAFDPRFVDYGNTYVASVGLPGTNVNIGELWVSYKIELKKPRLSVYTGFAGASFKSARNNAVTATPLGTTVDYARGTLNCTVGSNALVINEVAKGNIFSVTFMWSNPSTVTFTRPTASLTNCLLLPGQFVDDTQDYFDAGATASSARLSATYLFEVTGERDTMTVSLSGGALPANTVLDIQIIAFDPTAVYRL